ncbi:MAG: SDR family oxidoreductase [Oscillospiraceae bacterium]|nr:SDR family oxidoreductase [Oscillospiraceae bacterium]
MESMTNVKGRWSLITGASRGIGCQIAIFMAKQGCNLVLHSRNLEHTEKILAEVKGFGVEAYAIAAELSDLSAVEAMLDEIEAKTHVGILFNNAAVQVAYRGAYYRTPAEDFTTSFIINTTVPAMICYRFIPKMFERGFGRVINITSGIKNEPQQAGYSASKAALDKFTTDLATVTDGTDVIMSLVDPGWCRTDLGGPSAFHSVESVIPGAVVGAFVNDKKSGRLFSAQEFAGMSLEEAVRKAQGI